MEKFIIKYRSLIIAVFILTTVILGFQIPKAQINAEMEDYIPENMPSRLNNRKIDDIFGGTEIILLIFETEDVLHPKTLKRIEQISGEYNKLKGVEQVLSLFDIQNIKGEDGMMIVEPAVMEIPQTDAEREALREELRENDFVYNVVVSKEFKFSAIIATLGSDVGDEYIVSESNRLLEKYPGDEKVYLGGLPVTTLDIKKDIVVDVIRLLPLSLVLMLVILFLSLKQLRGVVLPFTVVLMSIIFGMGLLPLFGWDFSIITVLLPVMLIAIANNYGIHLISKYQELNTEDNVSDAKEISKEIYRSLCIPVLLTGLTTIAGILGLVSHVLIPAKELGVIAALGIGYALILSLFFIPAVLSMMRRSKPVFKKDHREKSRLDRLLYRFGFAVSKNPKKVIAGSLAFSIVAAIGVIFIKVDANLEDFFPDDHSLKITTKLINEHFGGAQNISVLVSGDIKNPDILKKMGYYEQEIKKIDGVGYTTSLASVIREMSVALNDEGDPYYDIIPDNRNAIAQYLELYSMSGDPDDFEKLVDFDYENAQIMIRINNSSTPVIKRVEREINEILSGDENVKLIAGAALVINELADLIVNGQLLSLSLAIVIVAILMILMFRSFSAGIIAAIPLILAMGILFGLMGYFGIRIDIATALLSSIMIGVGIDYTIHFLWRYKKERENGLHYREAVLKTLTTTGRGITFNAISVVIGFSVSLASIFIPIRFFGFLVVVSIVACWIGALVFVPALCIVWKPKFLEPAEKS